MQTPDYSSGMSMRNRDVKGKRLRAETVLDETYRRLRYVRYADDFLIGVIGSKADCVKIKSDKTLTNIRLGMTL